MTFRDLIFISAGNLRRMRLRTSLTVAGVAIAIATFTAMVSFGAGNQKYVTGQYHALGLLHTMQVYPREAAADSAAARALDVDALAELSRLPGVRLAYPFDAMSVTAVLGDSLAASKAQAIPAAAMRTKLLSQLVAGRTFESDGAKEAMVTPAFLRGFGVAEPDSAIGRALVLSVKSAVIDSGLAALVPRDPARIRERVRALDADSLLDGGFRRRFARSIVNEGIALFLDGFFNRRAVVRDTLAIVGVLDEAGGRARLEGILVPVGTAERFRSSGLGGDPADLFASMSAGNVFSLDAAVSARGFPRATLDLDPAAAIAAVKDSVEALGFRAFSFAEQFQEMRKFFLVFNLVLGAVGLVALVTASLGIVNTMAMSILERRREIGILKSLGAHDRDIKLLFLAESGVIGAAGAIVGIVAGWLMTRAASFAARAYLERQGLGSIELFALPYWLVLIALAIGVVVSIAAGYYPASRAAAVDPVEALRNE
jgi:ABC-type antimicrobial peptide transport system permease subunit